MNLQLIKTLCENRERGIRGLAEKIGMTEQNFHRCIRENKIQAQDLEKVAKELGVHISCFFDESDIAIRTAGRDFVENGNIKHSGTEFNGPISAQDLHLIEENTELKRRLIEAQDKIIKLMEEMK